MKSHESKHSGRRSGRGSRRARHRSEPRQTPAKLSFWQKLGAFFGLKPRVGAVSSEQKSKFVQANGNAVTTPRPVRKPEEVAVTSPKLYVGNLSFDAAESDLFELFNGVGAVRNAEIVTNKYNDKSKGFGFVTMTTIEEAKRAVNELHDKEFLGRKLVVSGAKSQERESNNYRG